MEEYVKAAEAAYKGKVVMDYVHTDGFDAVNVVLMMETEEGEKYFLVWYDSAMACESPDELKVNPFPQAQLKPV